MKNHILIALSSLLLITCCPTNHICDDEKEVVKIKVFQINDVYEIEGIEHGQYGNLARVATLINAAKKDTAIAKVLTVLSGDFISPSINNTLSFPSEEKNDTKVNGRQMVETLNAMGLDYVTFGNHEFDIKGYEVIQNRILESGFTWISSNLRLIKGDSTSPAAPFQISKDGKLTDMPAWATDTVTDKNGQKVVLGIIGLTLGFNGMPAYLDYEEYIQAGHKAMKKIQGTDIQLAITHLAKEEDIKLANALPGLEMVFGGHEHVNYALMGNGTPIYKADANARTIYIHELQWHPDCKKLDVVSQLVEINPQIEEDPRVAKVIDRWVKHQDTTLVNMGYKPYDTIYSADEPLDATEEGIRHKQTNMGRIITDAMQDYATGASAAILNSGSVRLDGFLSGEIIQLDILKTLPYGGDIVLAEMTGETLLKALNTSESKNQAKGSYLQYSGAIENSQQNGWLINGQPIKADSTYQIAANSYLMEAGDDNLEFLTDVPTQKLDETNSSGIKNDLRDITIHAMSTSGQ